MDEDFGTVEIPFEEASILGYTDPVAQRIDAMSVFINTLSSLDTESEFYQIACALGKAVVASIPRAKPQAVR